MPRKVRREEPVRVPDFLAKEDSVDAGDQQPVEVPEIVIGLVGALGTDLNSITEAIRQALEGSDYVTSSIRLSRLLSKVYELEPECARRRPLDQHYEALMDAGDRLRRELKRRDAVALMGVMAIQEERRRLDDAGMSSRGRAFVLHQLKTPEEVQTLRTIYGPSFVLLGAYARREQRVARLVNRIANDRNESAAGVRQVAERLVERDEKDPDPLHTEGQNVRDTFPLADAFVDAGSAEDLRNQVRRVVELLFGNRFRTPSADEVAMAAARVAALRSADLGRQVGAAITDDHGSVIALGTNEVPKAGGGQYWETDGDWDARDFRREFDANAQHKRAAIAEAIRLLEGSGLLRVSEGEDLDSVIARALAGGHDSPLRGSRLMGLIEFGRAVHAEMAAVTDAARRGVAIAGATLYSTTFPCHECARHIVSVGIGRVVYIDPYPKSLAKDLHSDAIDVEPTSPRQDRVPFVPFIGIAPRLYAEVFAAGEDDRKTGEGHLNRWEPARAGYKRPGLLPLELIKGRERRAVDVVEHLFDTVGGIQSSTAGVTNA